MSKTPVPAATRQLIARQFRHRCSYCQTQQGLTGAMFTLDHIVPESLGGLTVIENLCFACWDCNRIKQNRVAGTDPETGNSASLFHPQQQNWSEHFAWSNDGSRILGQTPVGRATVKTLRLNRRSPMQARRKWVEAGWHPPVD